MSIRDGTVCRHSYRRKPVSLVTGGVACKIRSTIGSTSLDEDGAFREVTDSGEERRPLIDEQLVELGLLDPKYFREYEQPVEAKFNAHFTIRP